MAASHTLEEVRRFLALRQIDLVGVAGAQLLAGVPEPFQPFDLMRLARSVVVFAKPIPRGVIEADRHELPLYWRWCSVEYRRLDEVVDGLCLLLEGAGGLATPIYSCFPQKALGSRTYGLLSLVYLGEAAGLGRVSRSGLLAHPGYGLRLLLAGVLTDLELPIDQQMSWSPCPPGCRACAEVCPGDAIDPRGRVDHLACARASNPAPLLSHLLSDPETKGRYSFETLLNTAAVDDHAAYECNACLRICPLNRGR